LTAGQARAHCFVAAPTAPPVATSAPPLAKLTRPRLHHAVARPRLDALLDEAVASRPIVWVSGPPGYGKTTLVAGWLESRQRRHLWYQIDPGDAVPGTFAHYMQLAAAPFVRKRRGTVALFPPQPQQELASFTRAFFRDLYALLPPDCVLVLDNFHDARTTSEQRSALAHGLDELPEGRTLIVVSRTEPPPEFARLAAAQRIARIEPAALACTTQESAAILGEVGAGTAQIERVLEATEGWPAALVLWREHLRGTPAADPDDASMAAGRDSVYAYFAGEVLQRAAAPERLVLMRCAVAPSVTAAEARALAGDDAARLLESLYRRHLFVERRHGSPTTYHLHPLFRDYLLGQARERLPAGELQALAGQAARLLAERGAVQEALALARDAQDWETLRALIRTHALAWARQARAQVLTDWIDALPPSVREADPWLTYWQGRAWIFLQPQRGRGPLVRAFEAFGAAGDRRGQALAVATLVTGCYYEWADFRPLDRWLPVLDELLGDAEGTASGFDRATELRLRAAHLIALLFRRPDPQALQRSAERLDALVDDEPDADVRVMAASIHFNYANWMRGEQGADALVARTQPLLDSGRVGPLMQLWWRTHLSFWHFLNGRYDACATVAAEARTIAERYGLQGYLFEIDHARAGALISAGDLVEARALVDAMESRLAPTRRMDFAYFHYLRSTLRQRLGLAGPALDDAERALVLARQTGLPQLQWPDFIARVGQARADAGDHPGALRALDEAVALAGTAERGSLKRLRDATQAEAHLAAGDVPAARDALAAVLAEYRQRGLRHLLRQRPGAAARLATFALAEGIEPDYVRTLIAHNRLVAPPGAGPAWPFRLRVQVLGGFALTRDGEPLRFSGKAQQRPLDLLKLLIALGGRDVEMQRIADALWPDADGAAAKTSFDSTLFRLRKLLDIDDLLVLAAGKLSLAQGLAWTDVGALEQAIDAEPPRDAAPAVVRAAAMRLLETWPGPLLGDEAHAWIERPRETLRGRVVAALLRLGERLERGADPAGAADLYRRALESDDLSETLHRALMRALAAAGQPAEALNAYRRCQQRLSSGLGVAPGPQTQALYEAILAAGLGPRG
jgi:LuxR family transcriptional regulator, maltose regulon positive regulatory protein